MQKMTKADQQRHRVLEGLRELAVRTPNRSTPPHKQPGCYFFFRPHTDCDYSGAFTAVEIAREIGGKRGRALGVERILWKWLVKGLVHTFPRKIDAGPQFWKLTDFGRRYLERCFEEQLTAVGEHLAL